MFYIYKHLYMYMYLVSGYDGLQRGDDVRGLDDGVHRALGHRAVT